MIPSVNHLGRYGDTFTTPKTPLIFQPIQASLLSRDRLAYDHDATISDFTFAHHQTNRRRQSRWSIQKRWLQSRTRRRGRRRRRRRRRRERVRRVLW